MTLNNEEFTDLKFQTLPTNISHPHKKHNIEDAVNPQEKAVGTDSAPTAETALIPRRPNPQNGWEPLPPFLQAQMIKATMKQLKKLKNSRQVMLDLEYWENNTRVMLSQQDPYQPLIISAQAGSGKSTWIQAFHLALKELFGEKSRLETSLVGTVIVLQKVAALNRLAEALNKAQCKAHIVPKLGATKLPALTPPQIQSFYNNLQRNGLSAKSVRNIHGILTKCLSTAVSVGYLRDNPCQRVTLPIVQ